MTSSPQGAGRRRPFTGAELWRLSGMYGAIALFHLVGWGFFLSYYRRFGPAYAGSGALAYSFGLRHAFDADHISAIDDTTRFLMQRGQRPLATGFFFSLGHSSVVVALATSIALAAESVQRWVPGFEKIGGTIGATISGTFLIVIAILDFFILKGIYEVWQKAKSGGYEREELDELMMQRGFINRILGSRWRRFISSSWQMLFVGLLFGLGLETASEVGLLALTGAASVSTVGGQTQHLPFAAIFALPVLFTAGMSLMDTSDGVFMAKAYGWAFTNPLRKVYYNLATVGLGIFVAGGVGVVEYLQVIAHHTGMRGAFWDRLRDLNLEYVGYFIVGTFVVVWGGSIILYKVRRLEARYGMEKNPELSLVGVDSTPGRSSGGRHSTRRPT